MKNYHPTPFCGGPSGQGPGESSPMDDSTRAANPLSGVFPPSIASLKRAAREDHSAKEEFKGHGHWLTCGCDQAKSIRQAEGYTEPGLRWDPAYGGGWVTAPAVKLS